jgi:hypothetical protein
MNEFADFGTELDWMGFLWGLHTATSDRFSAAEIYRTYRVSCHGNVVNDTRCSGSGIAFEPSYVRDPVTGAVVLDANGFGVLEFTLCDSATSCDANGFRLDSNGQRIAVRGGLRDAAERMFGRNSSRYELLATMGRTYGVDTNLAPEVP